jgi:hypothetical protein
MKTNFELRTPIFIQKKAILLTLKLQQAYSQLQQGGCIAALRSLPAPLLQKVSLRHPTSLHLSTGNRARQHIRDFQRHPEVG